MSQLFHEVAKVLEFHTPPGSTPTPRSPGLPSPPGPGPQRLVEGDGHTDQPHDDAPKQQEAEADAKAQADLGDNELAAAGVVALAIVVPADGGQGGELSFPHLCVHLLYFR